MSIVELGAPGEFVGSIGVIETLIYLASSLFVIKRPIQSAPGAVYGPGSSTGGAMTVERSRARR